MLADCIPTLACSRALCTLEHASEGLSSCLFGCAACVSHLTPHSIHHMHLHSHPMPPLSLHWQPSHPHPLHHPCSCLPHRPHSCPCTIHVCAPRTIQVFTPRTIHVHTPRTVHVHAPHTIHVCAPYTVRIHASHTVLLKAHYQIRANQRVKRLTFALRSRARCTLACTPTRPWASTSYTCTGGIPMCAHTLHLPSQQT